MSEENVEPTEFSPTQIAAAYQERKERSYERFLGCMIMVASALSCIQLIILALGIGYLAGVGR